MRDAMKVQPDLPDLSGSGGLDQEDSVVRDPSQSSPLLRAISLMERISTRQEPITLQALTEETGQPKATVHRMLIQLEDAELISRMSDGKHYTTGIRLRRLSEQTLLTDVEFAARHRVLADLVDRVGESCNLTALSGDQVIYLDRVETREPLRFTMATGTRVPAYASASGKILVAQLPESRRTRMVAGVSLQAFTSKTITDPERMEEEIRQAAQRGYAFDNEEFLPGLVCVAALVPHPTGVSNTAIAVQGPALRMSLEDPTALISELENAVARMAEVEYGAETR